MGVALPALDVPSVKSSHKSGSNRHLDALAAGPNRVKSPHRYVSGFSEEDAYNTHFDPACKRAPETLAPLPPSTPPARYGMGPASARDTEGVWTRQKKPPNFERNACLPPISHVSLPALSSNLPKATSIPAPLQQLPEPQGQPSLPFLSSAPTLSVLSSVPNPPRLPSPSTKETFHGFKRPMQSNLLNTRTALPDINMRKPLPNIETTAAKTAKTKLAPGDEGGITLHRPDAVQQVLQYDEDAYEFDCDSVASRTSLHSENAEPDATDDFYGLERGKHHAVQDSNGVQRLPSVKKRLPDLKSSKDQIPSRPKLL